MDGLNLGEGGDRRTAALHSSVLLVRAALAKAMMQAPGDEKWPILLAALDQLVPDAPYSSGLRLVKPAPRGGAISQGAPFVAIAGIDRFSGLREELGDDVADIVVRELRARILAGAASAHLGRVNRSSIEFTFFAADAAGAERTLRQLQRELERPMKLPDRLVSLDVTLGFAGRDAADGGLEVLVDRAEHALAKARSGHAKVAAFTERDRIERMERLSLMRDLRTAVSRQEMFVCYQPKLSLRKSEIGTVEALVRWRHPLRGLVPPDQFIGLAEEGDEIRPITEFVLMQAVTDAQVLQRAGYGASINVNISGQLVTDADFAAWALEALGDNASRIGFEITETAVIANPERALENIRLFAAAGIKISIDDYGSGLSSLSYLKQIPANELKIDKAFVTGLTTSHRDPLLVRSTIDLAHALEMEVTAEGVDNAMSLALLRVMGCDMVQGYYISKPLILSELLVFLASFQPEGFMRPPLRNAALR